MPEILAPRARGARCVIAGDPFPRPQDVAYRERLLALIAELELEDSVVVAGHVEDVGDVYAAADVIVNPARFNEPFGRVPFEAAVAGKPAVVTRVGAIPELLRDERSALIVEPEEPYALALAVIRVARRARAARRAGRRRPRDRREPPDARAQPRRLPPRGRGRGRDRARASASHGTPAAGRASLRSVRGIAAAHAARRRRGRGSIPASLPPVSSLRKRGAAWRAVSQCERGAGDVVWRASASAAGGARAV